MKHILKRHVILIFCLMTALALCAGILTACTKTVPSEDKIYVILNYNDGSGKTETVEYITALPTPTREGFSFDGWTVDIEGQTPVTNVTSGMTVYAQWSKLRYTVNFYVNNTFVKTCSVEHGESAQAPQPQDFQTLIPNDYVFDSWDKDFDNITSALTVNAVLKVSNARARFMSEVGAGRITLFTQKGLIGKPVSVPDDIPTRRGYEFIGWHKADGTAYSETDVFEAEILYFAHWKPLAPTMPTVSGLKSFTYGSALDLTSGDAREYLGITYDYAWLKDGSVISNEKTLNMSRINAGEHKFNLRITAHTSINGYKDSVSNSWEVAVTVNKAKLIATVAPQNVEFGCSLSLSDLAISYDGFKFDDGESVIKSIELLETDYQKYSLPTRSYFFALDIKADNYEVVNNDGLAPSGDINVLKGRIRINGDMMMKQYDGNVLTRTYTELDVLGVDRTDMRLVLTVCTTSANTGVYTEADGLIITECSVTLKDTSQVITSGFDFYLNINAYITPADVAYDGAAHSADLCEENASISYSIDGAEYSKQAPYFTNAGEYEIYVRFQKEHTGYIEKYVFNVNKAYVKITFDDISLPVGSGVPTYTYHMSGAGASLVTITPVCAYTPSSETGEYAITCNLQNTDNIDFSVTEGTLTVLAANAQKPVLMLTLEGKTQIVYGEALPVYTVSGVSGLIDGDSFDDVVSGTLNISCDYIANPCAGTFALTVNGLTSEKYDITTNTVLTVTKAPLTLSANEHSPIVYGSPVPKDFSFTASGFKFDDGTFLLDGVSVATTYTQRASASQKYDIFVALNGLNLKNYEISTVSAQLTVTKAQPQIILPFSGRLNLNYTGSPYDFKAEINALHSNTDENAVITPSILSGTDGGIYNVTLTLAETENYLSASCEAEIAILAAKIGYGLYTVEDALSVGGNIVLIGNAFLSQDAVIKQGTTLTLPCREDGTLSAYTDCGYNEGSRYLDPLADNLLYALTLKDGITLTINGTLAIGGETGQRGGAYQGHTTGMHSALVCGAGSHITVNDGGKLDCIGGFVVGDGGLTVNDGGVLKHNFSVLYFRGGTSTVGSFQQGGIAPFNVFDMPNIQVEQRINCGATVIAYCDLYAGGNHNSTEVVIVDRDNALINISNEDAYITVKHNGATDINDIRLTLSTYGDIRIGSLKLTIKFIVEITVDMAQVIAPLSYVIDLHVYGKLTVANRFKLLTGSNLTVEKGGELILLDGSGLITYTHDWEDSTFIDFEGNPISGPLPESNTWYPHGKADANLMILGKLTVQSGAFIAGNVRAQNGAELILSEGAVTSATSIEGVAVAGAGGQVWHKTAAITKTLAGINADGNSTALEAGNTYKYIDGEFQRQ